MRSLSNVAWEIEAFIKSKEEQGASRKECMEIVRLAYLQMLVDSIERMSENRKCRF